jgi:alkanesulfonate monooxygenase SsuD/methylene tetrahydromethanopterin reductase-like flavin-dependent oxidoreductase (luciferase family)
MIDALRELWSAEEPSHSGTFFSFDRAYSRPRPVQAGGIPIHVGGHSRAAARRAGRRGDGYFPLGLDAGGIRDRVELMRAEAGAAGRDPDGLELTTGGLLQSTTEDDVAAAERLGATRMVLSTTDADLDALGQAMDVFAEQFVER